MRADVAGGGIGQMEEHYKTFIVSFSLLSATSVTFGLYSAVPVEPSRVPLGIPLHR